MLRQLRVQAATHVAGELTPQRVGVVLRMAAHEEVAAVGALRNVHAGLVGDGHQLELRMRLDVLGVNLRVARVRRKELVVEAAHERGELLHELVREDAEHLLRQRVLRHAVVEVDARLRAPADVQCGVHVRAAPLHDGAELRPVVHLFEVQLLHRRARDDQAVEALVLDLVERGVERLQVLGGDVRCLVAGGLQ